jgi:exodeoxyribonuclease V alpha subunit
MSRLADIAVDAELEPIDLAFADLIARLATPRDGDLLARTAALVSRELRSGHACVDLAEWAGRGLATGGAADAFPEREAWRRALRDSTLIGTGELVTPLVLDDAGRCYLHRYWNAERRLAARILAVCGDVLDDVDLAGVAPRLAELFPRDPAAAQVAPESPDWQAEAAKLVLRRRLAIVSGGPGTGKTTTVARILALLLASKRELRIELAAPTGKAAARLTESIRAQASALPVDAELRRIIGELEARTIHRLLGYGGRGGRFRHDSARPLACDVVIVDEASMIDLLLMDSLLDAIPPHARLVLVGDKDQLASVDAGFVYGDLCEASQAAGTLRGVAVELKRNWRFRERPGIEALAAAVRAGDGGAAVAALADPLLTDATRVDPPADARAIVRQLDDEIAAVVTAAHAEDALAALARFRLLCATNRGPYGVETLNHAIERHLREHGLVGGGDWYRGRPVLVTANDYNVGLFNGDVGVCFPDADRRMRVWFPATDGTLRAIVPASLPPHVTAWAMTVHKSQGSEFDRVIVLLPPERDSPLLSRELVYTAVTRARERVTILGTERTLCAAIERTASRASGLRARLA